MHEEHFKTLSKADPNAIAKSAGCTWNNETQVYKIKALNKDYHVDSVNNSITFADPENSDSQASYLLQLAILTYMINAQDIPLSNKLAKTDQLDAGQFFFRGPHTLPLEKLQDAFGIEPYLMTEAAGSLNPKICTFGDASIEILVLPRIPMTIIIWAQDDEFPARASLLFDETAPKQMPLDALWVVGKLAISAIMAFFEQDS